METRQILLKEEVAIRWYNGNNTELKEIALSTFPELCKKALPKSWDGLKRINGYYIDIDCDVEYGEGYTNNDNKSIFATKEQAEASIALAQLSQLMKVYNDGWIADWSENFIKYTIDFVSNEIRKTDFCKNNRLLAFKDAETRDLFLENFRELILTAKPLL